MIQFNFMGEPYPTERQQEDDKAYFIKRLGPFKEEFENGGGVVTFNYSYPKEDTRRCTYNIGENKLLPDFMARWMKYEEEEHSQRQ